MLLLMVPIEQELVYDIQNNSILSINLIPDGDEINFLLALTNFE